MPDQEQKPPRHHLLIAGTGRAGTSFLVRWLAAAGLRTHLAAHDKPMWDDDANAGLEDLPVVTDWETAPYVMKSPWLVEVIDDVLANPSIVLDGVIIPVRELTESAASRVVQELQSAHRRNPWMSGLSRSFEQWGTTPGGVVYSLDPVDQARLLAVSFHRLVQRLVQADIPIVLLDFPRLALDADYLFSKLRRFVPATIAQARAAHAEIADPEKIRVGRELNAIQAAGTPDPACEAHDRLDAVALRREVLRLTGELAEAEHAAAAQQAVADDLRGALDTQAVELTGLAPLEVAGTDREAAQGQVAALIATVEQRRAAADQAAAMQQEAIAGLRAALDTQVVELAGLVAVLQARDADRAAAQAQVATLTENAEQWRAEAAQAAAGLAELRGALDARTTELAGVAAARAARDAELAAAQAQVATLTETAELRRVEAVEATAGLAELRGALDARAAELAEVAAAQAARDAELAATQASLATAEQSRAAAERAAAELQEVIGGLRSALDTRSGELAGLAATLEARDADLVAAQVRVTTLTALAEQRRAEAEDAATRQHDLVAGLRSALDAQAADLAGLAAAMEARDAGLAAAQARVASLVAAQEQQVAAAEHAAVEYQATVAALRSALDARTGEQAALTAALEAREADLAAAQIRIDTLTALADERRAAAEHAAVEHETEIAALRDALTAQAGEVTGLTDALAARSAELAAAQAQHATLSTRAAQQRAEAEHAAAEQRAEAEHAAARQRAEAEHATAEHQALVAGLRGALDARMEELTGLAATLATRDADLQAARAQITELAATIEQGRHEREAMVANWTWRAGRPLRAAGHAAQSVISKLRPGRSTSA